MQSADGKLQNLQTLLGKFAVFLVNSEIRLNLFSRPLSDPLPQRITW